MIARFRLIRSTQAVWSRRLAFFCVPLLLLTALLNRTEHIDPMVALTVIGLAVALATVAAALAAGALVDIWRRGHRGLRDALLGMGVGALVLTIAPAILTFIQIVPAGQAGALQQVIYGTLLVTMVIFRPQGLVGRRDTARRNRGG